MTDGRLLSDASAYLVVRRRFPSYVFVLHTSLSRQAASTVLSKAFAERWQAKWPSRFVHRLMKKEEPQLSGRIEDGSFSCQVRTNPVPSISGEVISRADGGADIVVRVNLGGIYLLWSLILAAGIIFTVTNDARITTKMLDLAAFVGWVAFMTWAVCLSSSAFVSRIFIRIFGVHQAQALGTFSKDGQLVDPC